ncbi:MAG: hypothetical protein Phog2KO_16480 [Phototrophicaceae bacterium]
MDIPNSLLTEIYNGSSTMFLGAGASLEAQHPSAWDLGQYLINESKIAELEDDDLSLDIIAEDLYAEQGYGKSWVRTKLIDYFQTCASKLNNPPSKAHGLLPTFRWRNIFTTNYDLVVEAAYHSKLKVQRMLPVYQPDPQNYKTKSDLVYYFKLNGCINEAERNINHRLVLTFSEQQKQVTQYKEFYERLRQEALINPIIFVGFSFTHPGSNISGTSPEFQQLENVLQELGELGRWHYCVTPYDDSRQHKRLIRKLEAAKIKVLNGTFEDFMIKIDASRDNIPPTIQGRESINVPVGKKSIEIQHDTYTSDLEHFETLGNNIEKLPIPTVRETMNGQYNWASFLNSQFIQRKQKLQLQSVIDDALTNEVDIVVFSAPTGWGKTFLLKDIAIDAYKRGQPIIWLNPYASTDIHIDSNKSLRSTRWDSERISFLLKEFEETTGKAQKTDYQIPILIADHCTERASELIAIRNRLRQENRQFILLISMRDYERQNLYEEYKVFQSSQFYEIHQDEYIQIAEQDIRELVNFCSRHQLIEIDSPFTRERIVKNVLKDKAEVALAMALFVIFDGEHRPFSEIVADFWTQLPNEIARQLVLSVSSVHRLGYVYKPRISTLLSTLRGKFTQEEIFDSYRLCIDSNILFEVLDENEPCVGTLHSLVAKHLFQTAKKTYGDADQYLLQVVNNMTAHPYDLEVLRRLIKSLTDNELDLSTSDDRHKLFVFAARATNGDYVICQQFSKYLTALGYYEEAMKWIELALVNNPDYPPILHQQASILKNWGIQLHRQGKIQDAEEKLYIAEKMFDNDRASRRHDEYAYTTHLDTLTFQIENARSKIVKSNSQAKGIVLFNQAFMNVPQEDWNYLLKPHLRKYFDPEDSVLTKLEEEIYEALEQGESTPASAIFLAERQVSKNNLSNAITILEKQNNIQESMSIFCKQAELLAKAGKYDDAIRAAEFARRASVKDEDLGLVAYWRLLISFIRENYRTTTEAINELTQSSYSSSRGYPLGNIWLTKAINIPTQERNYKEHAKIYTGFVDQIRTNLTGRIVIRNRFSEKFHIQANFRYWKRHPSRNEPINFVVSILNNQIRADDPEGDPYIKYSNKYLDLYVGR